MRRFYFVLLSLAFFVAQPLVAATYYVGSCKSGSFSTIQDAVNTVPSGSTVQVCPGTYAEQITISKALTLEGIPNWPTGPVLISDVGVSLTTTTSIYWGTVAPQVQVTAGPVDITNIELLENAPSACPATEIAIFYSSGSSGTVNGVLTNGDCNHGSIGIAAENGAGSGQSVTIENSQIDAGSNAGISVDSDQTPSTLTAEVKNNYIWTSPVGIMSLGNATGSISGNFITSVPSGGTGVWAGSANEEVSNNWIDEQNIGIDIEAAGVSVTSNHLFDIQTAGINISANNVTVKGNGVAYSLGSAIEFNCTTGDTVTGNTVNNAATGLDKVPANFTGSNIFYNTGTRTTGGCSQASAAH
jgi:hypothetical protein